jgi:hypothetical protein
MRINVIRSGAWNLRVARWLEALDHLLIGLVTIRCEPLTDDVRARAQAIMSSSGRDGSPHRATRLIISSEEPKIRISQFAGAATHRFCGGGNKAKLTARKAYGFRSYRCLEIALYHTLGQLPEPETTHRFC